MFKNIFLVVALLIFGAAGAFIFLKKDNSSQKAEEIVVINGHEFKIEVADTESARTQGLSGRESLCSECAMLFIFDKKGNYSLWMKEMKLDLDMLWIAGDEIVQIDKSVSAVKGTDEKRTSKFSVDKVLEINAGMSDKIGIKVGDRISLYD